MDSCLEYDDISGVNPELMVGVIYKLEELEEKTPE